MKHMNPSMHLRSFKLDHWDFEILLPVQVQEITWVTLHPDI